MLNLPKPENFKTHGERNRQQQLKQDLQRHLEKTLHPYTNPNWRSYLAESSLWQIHDPRVARHEFIRCMFYAGDRIWMGDVYHSGKPKHAANFKPVYDWLETPNLPYRCAAGIFSKGSHNRSQQSLLASPLIVIESDGMYGYTPTTPREKERNKALSFALIQYLCHRWELILRAIIDTGNKSLHAWFNRPSQHVMDCLIHMAESHHIDQGLLTQCQTAPLRLPGCIHEKTRLPARLLYLKSHSEITL